MPEGHPDPIKQIADAVLYEGYILWPYSRAATKNQRRWTFGGVYPAAHSDGRDDDPCEMRTECLVEADARTRVEIRVRFLQVVRRGVLRRAGDGFEPVDELTVGGRRHLSWDEAVEREVVLSELSPAELRSPLLQPIEFAAGSALEELADESGEPAGAIERSWRALSGAVEVRAEALPSGPTRLGVRISNASPFRGGDREEALRQTFVSTHTALRAEGGVFVSLTDPPADLAEEAGACESSGTWPVLVGEAGERHTILSSPIILPDYPEIAPESPGDLFDGAEIDGLLTLSILSLSEEERREMRDSDPRAREILERTEALSDEELLRLHGAMRDLQSARSS
ncbi:hypothetical protein BH24ACT25_BH24ACT25_02940 [soil metagenome]